MNIVRLDAIPWEDRVNTDNWPCRAGTYYDNPETELCIRLIDYPFGSIEPRHVHAGAHATTVLKNRAIVDGLTLGPLDVVLGPSNEPHGPLDYPEGCHLLSAFLGSYFHSEVETLAAEKHYRLIRHESIPWTTRVDGGEAKILVDRGVGPLLVEALRLPAGSRHKPAFLPPCCSTAQYRSAPRRSACGTSSMPMRASRAPTWSVPATRRCSLSPCENRPHRPRAFPGDARDHRRVQPQYRQPGRAAPTPTIMIPRQKRCRAFNSADRQISLPIQKRQISADVCLSHETELGEKTSVIAAFSKNGT